MEKGIRNFREITARYNREWWYRFSKKLQTISLPTQGPEFIEYLLDEIERFQHFELKDYPLLYESQKL